MKKNPRLTLALVAASLLAAAPANARETTLLARHASLAPTLAASPFGMPMHVESRKRGHSREGEVLGVLDAPYADVRAMTLSSASWCAVATLHPNVKACVEARDTDGCALDIYVGRRTYQGPDEAHHARMAFRTSAAGERGLAVSLDAANGPFGTRDYRLTLEAAPLDADRTVVRLRYGYVAGLRARLASSLYFATAGHHKVGFTEVDGADGKHAVRGARGAIERNAVRYFLALRAHLESDATLADRLARWVALRDRFLRQLGPLDAPEYFDAKQRELDAARTLHDQAGPGCGPAARHAAAAHDSPA